MEGQNQKADNPADLTALWQDCQKQPPGVLNKKDTLKNFSIFTGKHLCWYLFSIKLQAFSTATF